MQAKDYSEVNWADILVYDESSPSCLRWATDLYREDGKRFRKAGDVVGSFSGKKYWKVIHKGKCYVCHRIIYILFNGDIRKTDKIDHIDGNSNNNLITNLRLVTQQVNAQNKKKRTDNISGVTGVMLIVRNKGTTEHWEAQWMDHRTNKLKSKSFAVKKYGYYGALELACEYRNKMIEFQKRVGADYSNRHGL